MDPTVKILLVDDNQMILTDMAAALDKESDIEIVGTATSAEAAMSAMETAGADLVLTDISLPGGMSGVQMAKAMRAKWPDLKILLLSGHIYDQHIRAAQRAGLQGALSKETSLEELLEAIRVVAKGGLAYPR